MVCLSSMYQCLISMVISLHMVRSKIELNICQDLHSTWYWQPLESPLLSMHLWCQIWSRFKGQGHSKHCNSLWPYQLIWARYVFQSVDPRRYNIWRIHLQTCVNSIYNSIMSKLTMGAGVKVKFDHGPIQTLTRLMACQSSLWFKVCILNVLTPNRQWASRCNLSDMTLA